MAEKEPETDETAEANKENYAVRRRWPGPRTVYVPRADNGFGFTLRHFIVYPPESAMQAQSQDDDDNEDVAVEGKKGKRSKMSSLDPMDTIFVKQVKDGGPAHKAGLHTGDRIVSVNGESVTGKTYSQVIALIQSTDASLKLLVVPKDEDILQMAYQNSVYRSGSEPHRGEASEIPEPPTSHRPVPSYGPRGRHMSDSAVSVHRNKQHPSHQKYKAELRVLPEDGTGPRRKISDPGPHRGLSSGRTSTSSLGSTSSSGSSSQHSSGHGDLPTTVEVSESARHGYSVDVPLNEDASRGSTSQDPSLGKRTSARNITLSNLQTLDSQASRRSSDMKPTESSMRSQDMGTSRVPPYESQHSYPGVTHGQTEDMTDNMVEEAVVPEFVAEARSSAPVYSSPSHQSQRCCTGSPIHYKFNNQQSQSTPFIMGTVYSKPTSSTAATSSSISQSQEPLVSSSMRVPPAGTSSAAFITATSSASEGYHQPHRISGVYPGPGYSKDRRRGSSPTSIPSQSQPYRRGMDIRDDEYISSHLAQPLPSDDGGRGSPATSVHSWPDTRQHRHKYIHDHRYAQDPRLQTTDGRYGPAFTVRFRDRKGATIELPNEPEPFEHTYRSPHSTVTISTSRSPAHLPGYPPHINLVTERLKRFQSEDSVDSTASNEGSVDSTGNSSTGRTSGTGSISVELSRSKPLPQVGYESVSSRKAAFQKYSDENLSFEDVSQSKPPRSMRRERYETKVSKYSPHQAKPPPEIMKVPTTPPATISIYFRKDLETAMVTPSPERLLIQGQHARDPSDGSEGSMEPGRDRSPSCHGENHTSPTSPRKHKPALRQPSYLTAIHSPHSPGLGGGDKALFATISPLIEEREQFDEEGLPFADYDAGSTSRTDGDLVNVDPAADESGEMLPVSACATTTSVTTGGVTTTVYMRQPISDRESKLVRRVSYLMATQQEQPKAKITSAMSKSDSQLQPIPSTPSQIESAISSLGKKMQTLTLDLSSTKQEITAFERELQSTPTRTASNIRKLKAFFGEKTPRIVEATTERSKVFDLPAAGELVKEGYLLSKTAVADGKRSSDRSWKPYWILLRGHCLYLFKDKAAANTSPTIVEEQPISIKSCIVDIAYDYTKKKHVFRLTTYNGSEFLFQADERETMLDWIKAIQCNSNPDGDDKGVVSSELIVKKSSQVTESSTNITRGSPQQSQKSTKRSSSKTRSKSPASHSPGLRQKKASIDNIDSPKGKDKDENKGVSKTWKGKMVKKFKRYGSSSTAPVEISGTFGVPLDMCPPSTFNENVPLVVEVCTRIVEERGIENQGIYRVPGNTGAVNALQEELNKVQDVDDLNLDEDRWLDINVVSSLLKSFFRKLPEPIVTDDLYDFFINANRHENPEKRMLRLKKLVHELPDHNFDTFQYLATHLNKVASFGSVNKMDARNLAIVFGPTLIRTKDESMVTMVKDMSDQCRIVESILTHCEWFFSSWDADIDVPADEQEEGAMPVSGMNQELLTKAEHLELGERGKEFSAKDLVSSVISAANRKMKKREKSSKSVSSVDTGSMDSTDIPTGDYQPPCEYNERNIDREIELRSITEGSSMDRSIVSSVTGSGMTPLTGHGMASSSSTLTSTLSQERLLQQMVSSTHQRSSRSASSAGIQQHRARSQERLLSQKMQVHSHSAGNLPSMAAVGSDIGSAPLSGSTRDGIYNAKLVYITGTESQPNMTSTPQQRQQDNRQTNRQSVHYEVTKYPAYQLEQYQLFQTENAKPQLHLRRGSADSILSERRGDDEIGYHPSSVTKSRTYQAQQHIKRLQLDAAALRQKEQERRIESEKRALAKQRIELELEKTRAELERDDSLEELLAKPTQIAAQIAEHHSKYGNDYGGKADTTSLTSTSDYSTMSSTTTGHHVTAIPQPPQPSSMSDYSSNASPPRTQLDLSAYSTDTTTTSADHHVSQSDFPEGGKYFMVTGPARSREHDPALQQSSKFDTSKVAGRGTLSRKKGSQSSPGTGRKTSDCDSSPHGERRSRPKYRTGSAGQRRGSLDSNMDMYDRPHSTLESDSEVSEDFVDSMTSAFDEKLKSLSESPEFRGKGGRQPETYTVQYCENSSGPPQLTLPHSMQYYEIHRNNSESKLFDRYFSDSTFRTLKGDPKIGIASRFERKDMENSKDFEQKQGRRPISVGLNRDLSDPTGRASEKKRYSSESSDSKNSAITKSEKTDFNLLTKEMDARALEYAQALRCSSEKLYSSKEYLVDIGLDDSVDRLKQTSITEQPQRMPSPQVVRRKDPAARRKLRRRHTVGGTNDLEHFKALISVTGEIKSPTETISAWERLQPGLANDSHSASSSEAPCIMSWLQQQRLRHVGSSPAVFQQEAPALRDHDYYSTDLDDYSSDYRLQPVSTYHGTPRNPFHHQRYSQPPLSYRGLPLRFVEPGRLVLTPTDQRSQHSSVSSPDSASPQHRTSGKPASFTFESSI